MSLPEHKARTLMGELLEVMRRWREMEPSFTPPDAGAVVLPLRLRAEELEHAVTRRCAWLGDRCSMREALGAYIFHKAYAVTSQLAHRAARLVIP